MKIPRVKVSSQLAIALLCSATPIHAQAATCVVDGQKVPCTLSREEAPAVRKVVEIYLHGLKFNDVESFKSAFWPDAKLYFIKPDRSLGQLSQADWYKGFVASAGKEEAGDLRVVAVEVTGDAASAKVLETYPTSIYTDYLNLLRINGEWKIVNKIYTSVKR